MIQRPFRRWPKHADDPFWIKAQYLRYPLVIPM
jgi:hypothetical protein